MGGAREYSDTDVILVEKTLVKIQEHPFLKLRKYIYGIHM